MQTVRTENLAFEPLRHPVSQLAKSSFPTPQTSNDGAKTAGSHGEPLTRKQASGSTPDFKAMKYLNELLADLMPEVKICYHNTLYVDQIQTTYSEAESRIFLGWVRTFALLRRNDREQYLDCVIMTDESDFLSAFRLMQQRKIAQAAPVNPKCKRKVWDLLKIKFQKRTFTAPILARELFYNYGLLDKIITLLLLEKKIEFVKEISGQKSYRLRENSVVSVSNKTGGYAD